ncbi:MAG: GGDEF domain-containing protein [Alphaproteobacteria bacterium]|nr:GGDEF domain-containing protein [Alphaproteobacteria bacterium]MBU1551882.1 GGDEF domain-containing protein [Alphaproteobacteria bacterium]MBU2335310.1 GGDEF domain-containing protein [Alphaproteobacteria bacterium]MBU2391340.1 GGDEF domain-containing protein [Alphaproteobacteria bacterium]MDY6960453.1 GGDEF domain-containing protein [Pseudomonadota bacterium]|tara:strand:- start:491 stop:1744 length:1254 start_codon:yes stop_codon:yes gene_type:complete
MDILTGLVIWAAQALTLSVLLFAWWSRDQNQTYQLSWSGGFGMLGVGLILVGLRGEIPGFLSIDIANTLILLSIGVFIGGMLQFDGRRVEPFIIVPALLWIGGLLLPVVRETFSARVVLYTLSSGVGFAMLAAILLRRPGRSPWTGNILAAVLGIYILTSLAHAATAVVYGATSFETLPVPSLVLIPGAFCFVASVLIGAQMLTERSERRLKVLAATDPLTGALNRRGLIDEFQHLRQKVQPEKPFLALLHFDLDNFKQINDRCGHQGGDAVLVAFCQLAAVSFNSRGSFGRMGGEEFASILRVTDMVEAASIAEGLRMTLALQTIRTGEDQITVTVSAGISLQPAADADLDRLLTAADRALYAAKAAGRNCSAVDQNGIASIVPSAAMLTQHDMTLEIQASEQVTALRRLAQAASS